MTEEQIFLAALDLPDDRARNAYLSEACGEDLELRDEVEGLLAAHYKSGAFLDVPAAEQLRTEQAVIDSDAGRAVTIESTMAASKIPELESEVRGFLAPSERPDSLGRIGHYESLQVLGKGGFGIVFRAFDDVLQRVVAIKVMAPQLAATSPARKRFLREAQSSAQVRHENVVQVYEVGEQPLPYLAMEFIPGETLQQRLDRLGPLDVLETLQIGRQIAEGLAAAHATDLIHRDIKPGNVLLEGSQLKVKITDFGLARAADDASMTQSGQIAGTPMYMAPEQALGQSLDQRADLFSLGSVVYQMVSGRPPFRANTTVAALRRVVEDTPRPIRQIIPETPQWLCDIIAKLHAKKPDDRFRSAREVADVLADCEAQLKAYSKLKDYSRIPSAVAKERSSGSRKWATVAAALLFAPLIALVLMELAGVTHLFRGRQVTPDARTSSGPFTDGDVKRIAALPATAQVEEVRKELKRLNPEFDGILKPTIESNVVTELSVNTDEVDNLAPVRALTGLVYLDCRGTYPNKGKLSDLSPLAGTTLRRLDCSSTQVADLAPLAELPLTYLHFNHNPVSDLRPLTQMPLLELGLAQTNVSDLSPLKGLKLKTLGAQLLPVTDLSPLAGMPLKGLDLYHTMGVTSLEPLKGMPLEDLNLQDLPVSDLSPLRGMTTLRTLHLAGNQVSDLTPLGGLQLTDLLIRDKQVTDLSPLKGMPLVRLHIYGTGVSDLTPLAGMPLQEFRLTPEDITQGLEVLREIKSLKTIGIDGNQSWPPAEFWERFDKGEFEE